MKNLLTLMCLSCLMFTMTACPKRDVDPTDYPTTGSLSLTIDGVTYSFTVDYKATGQQNAATLFTTVSSGNTTTLTAANMAEGTAFAIKVNKAIQTIGDYTVSPSNETGVVTFSTKTKNYQQFYQKECENTILYTNVTLGISKLSKNNSVAEGTISGKMVVADGQVDCPTLKVTKWKQVDITGAYRLYWANMP